MVTNSGLRLSFLIYLRRARTWLIIPHFLPLKNYKGIETLIFGAEKT
jgi:hypothetical protein